MSASVSAAREVRLVRSLFADDVPSVVACALKAWPGAEMQPSVAAVVRKLEWAWREAVKKVLAVPVRVKCISPRDPRAASDRCQRDDCV